MFKGNVDIVKEDGIEIVRRLRETDVTMTELKYEYQCNFYTLQKAIKKHLTTDEYKKLMSKRMSNRGKQLKKRIGPSRSLIISESKLPEQNLSITNNDKTLTFENGYRLEISDLGTDSGLLFTLISETENNAAILIPNRIVPEMIDWLQNTLGQEYWNKQRQSFTMEKARHFDK